jgi:hypothetical protein
MRSGIGCGSSVRVVSRASLRALALAFERIDYIKNPAFAPVGVSAKAQDDNV